MRLCGIAMALLLSACSKDQPAPADSSATAGPTADAAPAAVFDIDAFCEKAMALPAGRQCEGDDEIIEGNKVGFCTTVLRAGSDAARVSFDEAAAKRCLAEVKSAKPPLPDRRTLADIGARFEACRSFARGTQKKGEPCDNAVECGDALTCESAKCTERKAATEADAAAKDGPAKKKAGEPCAVSDECLGRCSRKQGRRCVSYCGSG
jgi:hypothetical protein